VIANTQCVFRIQFPQMFPSQAPYILLMGITGSHQNLSQQNYVLHPKLNTWTAHSNLAAIFTEIAQAFVSNPPKKLTHTQSYSGFQQQQPIQQQYQPQQVNSSQSFTQSPQQSFYQSHQVQIQPQQIQQPIQQKPQDKVSRLTAPTQYTEVKALGESKQKSLLANEDDLNVFVKELAIVKDMNQFLDDLNAENKKLQISTMAKEKLAGESKQGNTVLKNEHKIALDSFEHVKRAQDEKQGKFTPQILAETLKRAMNDADEKSNTIADKYLSTKNEDVSTFLNEYLKEREVYYTRKTKLERFKI
jgi:hypothetical protein